MKIRHAVRREAAAAWRSLCYDLRLYRPGQRPGYRAGPGLASPAPDHRGPSWNRPAYEAYTRRPYRVRTATLVAVIAVGGVAATYLGVLGGLSTLLADDSEAPDELPSVTVDVTGPGGPQVAAGGLGSGGQPVGSDRPVPEWPRIPDPGQPWRSSAPGQPGRPGQPEPGSPPTATIPGSLPGPTPEPTGTCGCADPSPDPTDPAEPDPSPTPTATRSVEPDQRGEVPAPVAAGTS